MSGVKIAVLVIAGAAVLALAASYFLAGHRVPAGQPPLADLTGASLDGLRSDFNRTPEQIRIILLLSPT